jgi:hypothetical protein
MQEPDHLGRLLAQKSRTRKHLTPKVLQQAIADELPANCQRVRSVNGGYTLRTQVARNAR